MEAGGCGVKRLGVLRMYDGLHRTNPRMPKEGCQGRSDHRLTGNISVLLWNVTANALATSGRDDDGRNSAHHMALLRSRLRHSL
jgi:hypothetical protein